jgi:uncharacterized membrane protein
LLLVLKLLLLRTTERGRLATRLIVLGLAVALALAALVFNWGTRLKVEEGHGIT